MEITKIGTMELESPLIAAASSATSRLEDLCSLNRTAVGAIITKSTTLEERPGNPETNFFTSGPLTINAQGLPGRGVAGDIKVLEQFQSERTKPLILSVAGLQPNEYLEIVKEVQTRVGQLYDAIELNLSCPNVAGKPIISYDHHTAKEIIEEILAKFPQIPFGIKIAPHFSEEEQKNLTNQINTFLEANIPDLKASFSNSTFYDLEHLKNFARILLNLRSKHDNLSFISATNTLPNCRLTKPDGSTALNSKANNGQGGLSGEFLHPIAVKNVQGLAKALLGEIKIIATGGARDANSVKEFFDAGAHTVALGTSLINLGPRGIEQILTDL